MTSNAFISKLPAFNPHSPLARLAVPRWFSEPMLAILLPELGEEDRQLTLDDLLDSRRLELAPGRERYRVQERYRLELIRHWWEGEHRPEYIRLSEELSAYCAGQVSAAQPPVEEWKAHQLYHLAIFAPGRAMRQMRSWFNEAVEQHFDLNQGYRWLLPLEERREILAELELRRKPPATWTAELLRLREYLTARAFWTEEWYKTINFLPRQSMIEELDRFFETASEPTPPSLVTGSTRLRVKPWLLNLHAPGGHGKTSTIEWILARYALPRGFTCARFDYDTLPLHQQIEYFEQPEKILVPLAASLNAQRSRKIEALERQAELRDDPVGWFTLVLREVYGDAVVVFFIDTLEVVLDRAPEAGPTLEKLLRMFRNIREGDQAQGGSVPGYANLRLVLSGRQRLLERFPTEVRQSLGQPRQKSNRGLPLVEFKLSGFNRQEGRQYLSKKRKLTDKAARLINPILSKASDTAPGQRTPDIIPLKLALYADLVKEEPDISPEEILKTEQVDVAYLVNRILSHIQDPRIHWLLRYGVIFRKLDALAAQVLLPFLEQALAGKEDLDNPALDPQEVTRALQASRTSRAPVGQVEQLLQQLARYSWVERHGEYVQFHPNVGKTQHELISRQPIFKVLQQAAFEHYAARAEQSSDPLAKANFIREAVHHVMQLGETGADYWLNQFNHYRKGPGPVLWALIDEVWEFNPAPARRLFNDDQYFEANLALAGVLLDENYRPFLPDQLEQADTSIRIALRLAGRITAPAARFRAETVAARIALARRRVNQALELAQRAFQDAESTEQQVEALKLVGEAEAANSRWQRAIATLRDAYERSRQSGATGQTGERGSPEQPGERLYHEVHLELVERLLDSPHWLEALPLLDAARATRPNDPEVLELAARLAFKQARFEEAARLYRQTLQSSTQEQRARIKFRLQMVELYQGAAINPGGADNTLLAVLAAAARTDWPGMETALRTHLVGADESETLEIINILVQYYLEVTGDWRQVRALLERGDRLAGVRTGTDPAVARLGVLRQYVDFLNNSPPLDPALARQDCDNRIKQVENLQTPEERVRAKAYLLLVRFFGQLDRNQRLAAAREAVEVYHSCAGLALERTIDILLNLAPLDQVDIMRTLAALPDWSSSAVNEIAPDPAERSPLRLLARTFGVSGVGERRTFLNRLAEANGLNLSGKLAELQNQIASSEADWPLLYTSLARLLDAFGQPAAAWDFINRSPVVSRAEQQGLAVLVAHDRAFIAGWDEARQLLEGTIERLENLPGASSLTNELMLIWAYLGLDKGSSRAHWDNVSVWLTRLFALPFTNPSNMLFFQEYFLLHAIAGYKLNRLDQAAYHLRQARNLAEGLGNTYAIGLIKAAQTNLQADLDARNAAAAQAIAERPATSRLPGQTAPPEVEPDQLEFVLQLEQLDTANVRVVLTSSSQPQRSFKTLTRFLNLKKLLPQGRGMAGLPDLDYWQKLLNFDSNMGLKLEDIGQILFDELLPPGTRGRKMLEPYLQMKLEKVEAARLPAMRLVVQGKALEGVPWSLLYDRESGCWPSRQFRFSRNRVPELPFELQGLMTAVRPVSDRPDPDGTLHEIELLYRDPITQSRQVYGPDLLDYTRQKKPTPTLGTEWPDFSRPVKILHLLGDLSQINEVDGIFLNLGRSRSGWPRELLTPDALAHHLRQLGIVRALLILEPLSTGSAFENIRVLMLRNFYASALARLGNWTVLALGPRRGSSALLRELIAIEKLTVPHLEDLVRQVRLQTPPAGPDRMLEGQYGLFFPAF